MVVLAQDVREVLEGIPYNTNDIYLHTDASFMPVRRSTWAAWNFLGISGSADSAVCVTYWLNRLQHLPPDAAQMFATLNPLRPPALHTVLRQLRLAHPVFSFSAVASQHKLPGIQVRQYVFSSAPASLLLGPIAGALSLQGRR